MPKTFNSFDEVRETLSAYIPTMGAHAAYRLDRMEPLMKALGDPQHSFRAIHVAGTSGKTSTCYYIAALLASTGAKVGLTVSPHIDEINERVQINLTPLPEKRYCALFGEFMQLIEDVDLKPTYFELLVAFAYWVFAREGVEYAVIEVGLGGLLDSTNVITRTDKVCVITDIGFDHTDILGKTLPEITAQKAGIIGHHNNVFMYAQGQEVMRVVREVCEQQKATLHEIASVGRLGIVKGLPPFQRRNWYLASRVVRTVLKERPIVLSDEQLRRSSEVVIPGRMQVISFANKTIILDGAHNPQKMQAFIKSLKSEFPGASFAVMLGMKRSKVSHVDHVLTEILRVAPHVIITSLRDVQEAMRADSVNPVKIAEKCHMLGYDDWEVVAEPTEALATLLSRPEDVLVVTGSFYLIGYIRSQMPDVV